jgi:hypothetical protein
MSIFKEQMRWIKNKPEEQAQLKDKTTKLPKAVPFP